MNIGPLSIFQPTSNPRAINLAAWHSRHSLTWSWILSASLDGRWRWPRVHGYETNDGLQIVATIPGVVFHWNRQREMWFRDLYRRLRDEADGLKEQRRAA